MTNNIGYIPTEEEVLKEITEYNNRRSGPILDDESKTKALEYFFTEVLHGKAWEAPNHQTENTKPIGLDGDNSTLEH